MMRKIEPTTQFKRDYKREKKGKYREVLEPHEQSNFAYCNRSNYREKAYLIQIRIQI